MRKRKNVLENSDIGNDVTHVGASAKFNFNDTTAALCLGEEQ